MWGPVLYNFYRNPRPLQWLLAALLLAAPLQAAAPATATSNPGDVDASSHLPARQLRPATILQAQMDAQVQATTPELLDLRNVPAVPDALSQQPVVELYRLRSERIGNNGLSYQVIQRVFRIQNQAGANLFGVDDIWYDASRTEFHLWRLQVHHLDGSIQNGSDDGDSNPESTGNRSRRLRFPQLRPGDLIEVIYVLTPVHPTSWAVLGNHYLGDLYAFRGTYPVLRVRYVLRSSRPLAVTQSRLAPPQARRAKDGAYIWTWEGGPYQPCFVDSNGPSITDQSPYVQVSSFNTWPKLAHWYEGWLQRRSQLTPALRHEFLTLVPPRRNQRDTVRAVWNYLSQHLSYLGDEDAVHAYVPRQVQSVLQAQRGDCKDGALLFSTWLRAEGIPAEVALVRTRRMGQVLNGAATLAAFDHAVVYLPLWNTWLDTTAPELHFGELPSSDQGAMALIIAAPSTSLRQIPFATPRDNDTQRTVRLYRRHGGWLAVGAIIVRGADAPGMREQYASPQGRRNEFRQWLDYYFPQARVLALRYGLSDGGNTVHLGFRAFIPAHGAAMTAAWIRRQYASNLASERLRDQAKFLDLRWQSEQTLLFQVGAAHCAAANSWSESAPFGAIQIRSQCQRGWLRIDTNVVQQALQISPDQYPTFRRFWLRADRELDRPLPLQR